MAAPLRLDVGKRTTSNISMSALGKALPSPSTNQPDSKQPGISSPAPSAKYVRQSITSLSRPSVPPQAASEFLIPTHLLQDHRLSTMAAPFGVLRSTDDPRLNEVVYLGDRRVKKINSPLTVSTGLPPLAELHLRSHGWNEAIIRLVGRLHSDHSTHPDFLVEMGVARMPILEAYFVWILKSIDN